MVLANVDFTNSQGSMQLNQAARDWRLWRPYLDTKTGRPCVTINTGKWTTVERKGEKVRVPVLEQVTIENALARGYRSPVLTVNDTILTKDEWIYVDQAIVKVQRQRLKAWNDLIAAGNTVGGFDAYAKTILERQVMSDDGEAVVDMDGLTPGRNDSSRFKLEGTPLPITHSDFVIPDRLLQISRQGNAPFDTVRAEQAARRVFETVEKTLIGTLTGLQFGNSSDYVRAPKAYGYTNFPARLTKTDLTTPDGNNSASTVEDVLAMRELLMAAGFYGPYVLYHSTKWDQFLDNDHYVLKSSGAAAPNTTLRKRLMEIEGLTGVKRLDYLTTGYQLIMVQMTSEVVRAINGMPVRTVQWATHGGLQANFKVMGIMVAEFNADFDGNCGVCHATTGS